MSFRHLVLLDQVRPTGLVGQLVELLSRLERRGVDLKVICVARRGADVDQLQRTMAHRGVPTEILWEEFPFDLRPLLAVGRTARHWRPDLVETHGYKSAAYGLAIRRRIGTPWIAVYHGRTTTDWKVRAYHAFERLAMSSADAIVAVGRGVESHLRPRDRDRVEIIPNGVVPLAAGGRDRSAIRAAHGFSRADTVLGFVGRLSSEKGPDLFLGVMRELGSSDLRVKGLVVGNGPMREALDATVRRHLEGSVTFTGRVDDVAELYAAMDVLVISSRSEVFPNVLLEAIDQGLPVAATAVGAIPWIARGMPSVFVTPHEQALSAAVRQALQSSADDRDRARSTLHERFSQEKRVERALAIYRAVLTRGE